MQMDFFFSYHNNYLITYEDVSMTNAIYFASCFIKLQNFHQLKAPKFSQ